MQQQLMYHVATSKGDAEDDYSRDKQHRKDEPKEALVGRWLRVPTSVSLQ